LKVSPGGGSYETVKTNPRLYSAAQRRPGGVMSLLAVSELSFEYLSGPAARTLLACLKLRPDRLNRPLQELSGGERSKVALVRILTSGANLLLLDEPTNHLEIEAQEALEQALRLYPGTVIVVSHDRYFLDALGPGVASLNLSHAHNS
jgi:ATPase subunit of ABC transporter with duplicated ATPase domains